MPGFWVLVEVVDKWGDVVDKKEKVVDKSKNRSINEEKWLINLEST